MPRALRMTFLIHALVSVVSGLFMLIIPGRTLGFFGWAPIDPILGRVLGAALLALGWSSFRGWLSTEREQVQIVLELEVAFAVLACVGLLRHLLFARYPLMVWLLFALFLVFAVAWIVFLLRRE